MAAASIPPILQQCTRKIVVFGGAGYVGSAICRAAVQNGMEVVSITRSGVAGGSMPWASKVKWVAADALDPHSYEEHLEGCSSVVHTVGILLEKTGFKKLLLGRTSGVSTRDNIGVTYEHANRDSALQVARAAARKGIASFIYISATGAPPGIDKRYISTKREAESALLAHMEFRPIIFRPGFIYSEEYPKTLALALPLLATDSVSRTVPPLAKYLHGFLRSQELSVSEPVALHTLADAVIQAIRSPDCSGIFDPAAIHRLSNEAFSTSMCV